MLNDVVVKIDKPFAYVIVKKDNKLDVERILFERIKEYREKFYTEEAFKIVQDFNKDEGKSTLKNKILYHLKPLNRNRLFNIMPGVNNSTLYVLGQEYSLCYMGNKIATIKENTSRLSYDTDLIATIDGKQKSYRTLKAVFNDVAYTVRNIDNALEYNKEKLLAKATIDYKKEDEELRKRKFKDEFFNKVLRATFKHYYINYAYDNPSTFLIIDDKGRIARCDVNTGVMNFCTFINKRNKLVKLTSTMAMTILQAIKDSFTYLFRYA